MVRTITLGSCVSVQGIYIRDLPEGRVLVRVGEHEFAGRPINSAKAA